MANVMAVVVSGFSGATGKQSSVNEDILDESVLNIDISVKRLVIVDHPASFDQHFFTL